MHIARHGLLLFVLVTSSMACLLCILSLATNNWLTASAVLTDRLENHINYGLFAGHLERQQLAAKLPFELTIVCDFGSGAGVCMFSCQRDAALRQDELTRILAGASLVPCEQVRLGSPEIVASPAAKQLASKTATSSDADVAFVPAIWWLCTVLGLVLMLIFEICSVAFAVLNLITSPVERIFNIFGLYIWNGSAIGCALLTLTLWMELFLQHLQKNIAITDTLRAELTFTSSERAKVSYSLYMPAVASSFNALNIGLLLMRRRLLSGPAVTTTVIIEQADTPLQFY